MIGAGSIHLPTPFLLGFTEWFGLLLTCGLPVGLILLGLIVGTMVQSSHLRNLDQREEKLKSIPVSDIKRIPDHIEAAGGTLVVGSVVVATDYFRTFTASLKKLIGGEIGFYDTLLNRARREAICRLLEDAQRLNAVAVINVRLETSNVGGLAKNPAPMVEVVAYGTAILPRSGEVAPPLLRR